MSLLNITEWMPRAIAQLGIAGCLTIFLAGCLFSDTEVVRRQDSVIVPGLGGEYYQLAASGSKETKVVAGRSYNSSSVHIMVNADTREYAIGGKGRARLMPAGNGFYLVQIEQAPTGQPQSRQQAALQDILQSRWVLMLARIDATTGFFDLHCTGPIPKPRTEPSASDSIVDPIGGATRAALASLVDAYRAPRDREATLRVTSDAATSGAPVMFRLVRKDMAERGLTDAQATIPGPNECIKKLYPAGSSSIPGLGGSLPGGLGGLKLPGQ